MDRTSPNVLSVGTVEYNSAARRALLASGRAHIWTATSLSELRRIGDTHEFGVSSSVPRTRNRNYNVALNMLGAIGLVP